MTDRRVANRTDIWHQATDLMTRFQEAHVRLEKEKDVAAMRAVIDVSDFWSIWMLRAWDIFQDITLIRRLSSTETPNIHIRGTSLRFLDGNNL